MMYRYVGISIDDSDKKYDISKYSDSADVSTWAEDAMAWAVGEGIITGKPNNILDPKASATRTEVAAMFMRFVTSMEE